MLEKKELVSMWENEFPITLRIIKAMPEENKDIRPHEKIKNALELATVFGWEAGLMVKVIDGSISMEDFMNPPKLTTMTESVELLEKESARFMEKLKATSEEDLAVVGKHFGQDQRLIDALMEWMHDIIHHRGQFSIYIRLAGAKLPSIYGPTAEDPMTM